MGDIKSIKGDCNSSNTDCVNNMSFTVGLIVVFNHRYDNNLRRIRDLYRGRFSNIVFLVPFYDGCESDVVSVYAASDNFSAYFAQAYVVLEKMNFDYWFVVADDMIINPALNEKNLREYFCISKRDSYITGLRRFDSVTKWVHAWKWLEFELNTRYIENLSNLPSIASANESLSRFGVDPSGLSSGYVKQYSRLSSKLVKLLEANEALKGEYPMCWGYSDIFVIGRNNMKKFCHIVGVFSASCLFAEISIPTAIALATEGRVVCEKDVALKGRAYWGNEIGQLEQDLKLNLSELLEKFPKEQLYYHPIKLSKWK